MDLTPIVVGMFTFGSLIIIFSLADFITNKK